MLITNVPGLNVYGERGGEECNYDKTIEELLFLLRIATCHGRHNRPRILRSASLDLCVVGGGRGGNNMIIPAIEEHWVWAVWSEIERQSTESRIERNR